jgi:hypothetical protein
MAIWPVDLAIEHGDFAIEHGDLANQHGDLAIENGDFPLYEDWLDPVAIDGDGAALAFGTVSRLCCAFFIVM